MTEKLMDEPSASIISTQRMRMVEPSAASQRQSPHRRSTAEHHHRIKHPYNEIDRGLVEENVKIVEMDYGDHNSKGSLKSDMSPRAAPNTIIGLCCSGHLEECCFSTAQSSPQYYYSAISKLPDASELLPFAFPRPEYAETVVPYHDDYPLFPNYMAKTEPSRAKVSSQSAPKSRPSDNNSYFERQPSRQRASVEGRMNHVIPRAVMRMQRSSSQVRAATADQNYRYYPWSSIKLER